MMRVVSILLIATTLAACAPPASQGDFDSDNPAAKLYAIRRAGEAGDRSKIPKLVEQLDNDDEAVRMMSIEALRHITGQDLGYDPFVPPADRQPAIQRWQQAVRDGRFAK
jgi:hypothetical protein